MAYKARFTAALAGLALAGLTGFARGDAPVSLGLPLACQMGKTCFIQQYPDEDPGPGAKDYACGSRTYDKHTGIDMRVPTTAARKAGVAILAAAAGKVRNIRDNMPDAEVQGLPPGDIKDKECGNGVVIVHPDGWETQYCHMELGSVVVMPGQQVSAGQKLGLVGQSGDAEFPHLHFEVRKDGRWIDPLAYGAKEGQCLGGKNLFTPAARAALAYKSPDVLNIGFADAPTTMAAIEAGLPALATLKASAPAMVFYVRVIGLEAGDRQHLSLTGPDGKLLSENITAMDRPKAQYMAFVGKKNAAAWAPGTYRGRLEVTRAGAVVLSREAALVVR